MTIGLVNNRTARRFTPAMPSHLYRTYRALSPVSTHFRPATCAEVQCTAYTQGWTYVKEHLIRENLLYAVTHAGKRYREMTIPVPYRDSATDELKFGAEELCLVFEPGQMCFQARGHRLPLERPEFFYTGRGDYRTFSTRNAQKLNADDWVDHFANHVDKLNTAYQKG